MKKAIIIFIFFSAFLNAQNYGTWFPIADLNEERYIHAAVELDDGNVLVTGGELVDATLCEIYNVSENTWTYTTPMNRPRFTHNIIKLIDGKIMVIGGIDKSCEIYDPSTKTWAITDSINQERTVTPTTVTLLDDGRVLITGGWFYNGNSNGARYLNTSEIYDPQTGKWSLTDSLKIGRDGHTATKLKNGKVLVVGGYNKEKGALKVCEIYDPVANKWSFADSLKFGRYYHSALLLNDGKVLVTGGSNLTECELYDPESDKWSTVGSSAGSYDKSVLLNDSTAMLLHSSAEWELYDVKNFKSIYLGSSSGIYYSNVLKLSNGKIITTGGLIREDIVIIRSKKCMLYTQGATSINESFLSLRFELKQNYPNPFNPITTITYVLPSEGLVQVKVFDILGREIETLVNNFKSSGKHSISWDGSKFASGMYFCSVTFKNQTLYKKMLMVK